MSANYRAALLTMSKVTAAFADALETCSGYVYNLNGHRLKTDSASIA
jgi:hypothetical protein